MSSMKTSRSLPRLSQTHVDIQHAGLIGDLLFGFNDVAYRQTTCTCATLSVWGNPSAFPLVDTSIRFRSAPRVAEELHHSFEQDPANRKRFPKGFASRVSSPSRESVSIWPTPPEATRNLRVGLGPWFSHWGYGTQRD